MANKRIVIKKGEGGILSDREQSLQKPQEYYPPQSFSDLISHRTQCLPSAPNTIREGSYRKVTPKFPSTRRIFQEKVLWVGNLPNGCPEENLRDLFAGYDDGRHDDQESEEKSE